MIFKKLGNTDLDLSALGLGAWSFGGGGYRYGWGEQDDKDSIATIHRSLDLGINWIDTAPAYGEGHSEEIIGKALKEINKKPIIATKCGLHVDEKKEEWVFILKKESIRAELEASLKRLKTDVIDLYQVHAPFPEEDIEEAWDVLEEFKKEGKIRYAGVSNFSLDHLKRVQPMHPVASLQPQYSMLERTIENETMDYCAANNIGIIAFSPMCRGLLTGKFTKERLEKLPDDDNRLTMEVFREPYFSANLQLIERLRPIAERNNKTLPQLAVAWVLRRPEITAAIVGARKPSQIEQTVPAGDWILSGEDKVELDEILKEHHVHLKKLKT